MIAELFLGGEQNQTSCTLEIVGIVVPCSMTVQRLLTSERGHANIARESGLDVVGALDVAVQKILGRKLFLAVRTRNADLFVDDVDMFLQLWFLFELLVTHLAGKRVHIAVTQLMFVPGGLLPESQSARITQVIGDAQMVHLDVLPQIGNRIVTSLAIRANVLLLVQMASLVILQNPQSRALQSARIADEPLVCHRAVSSIIIP